MKTVEIPLKSLFKKIIYLMQKVFLYYYKNETSDTLK